MTLSNNAPKAHLQDVMTHVLAEFPHLTRFDLISSSRKRCHARPRQIAFAVSRELSAASLPQIGRFYGDRDHTTVLYGVRRIAKLRETDKEIDTAVEAIIRKVMRALEPDSGATESWRARVKRTVETVPLVQSIKREKVA